MANSIVIYDAKRQFFRHPKILELTKDKKIEENLKWSQSIGGGMRNDEFDCVVYVGGLKKGKVLLKGSRNE